MSPCATSMPCMYLTPSSTWRKHLRASASPITSLSVPPLQSSMTMQMPGASGSSMTLYSETRFGWRPSHRQTRSSAATAAFTRFRRIPWPRVTNLRATSSAPLSDLRTRLFGEREKRGLRGLRLRGGRGMGASERFSGSCAMVEALFRCVGPRARSGESDSEEDARPPLPFSEELPSDRKLRWTFAE